VVLTASAGNYGNQLTPSIRFPQWMADPKIIEAAATSAAKGPKGWSDPWKDDKNLRFVRDIKKLERVPHSMMIVGAVNKAMELSSFSQVADHVEVYAPGEELWALSPPRAPQNADTILPFKTNYFGKKVVDKDGKTVILEGTSMGTAPAPSLLLLTDVHWILIPD
jgi:hypothetical protein